MSILSEWLKKLKKSQPLNSPIIDALLPQLIPPESKKQVNAAIDEILMAIIVARMIIGDENKYKNAEVFANQVQRHVNGA